MARSMCLLKANCQFYFKDQVRDISQHLNPKIILFSSIDLSYFDNKQNFPISSGRFLSLAAQSNALGPLARY